VADLFTKSGGLYVLARDGSPIWTGDEVGLLWDDLSYQVYGYGDQTFLRSRFDAMAASTEGSPAFAVCGTWDVADLNRFITLPGYVRHLPMWDARVLRRASVSDPLDVPEHIVRRVTAPPSRGRHEVQGTVSHVIYSSGNFVVLNAVTPERVYFTAAGNADPAEVRQGVTYLFMGRWTEHPKHGTRFTFDAMARDVPMTRNGVSSYFKTTLAGIGFGERSADKVWQKYGHESVHTIASDPARVAADTGLPIDVLRKASEIIRNDAASLRTKVALHSLLGGRGFPRTVVDDCISAWGPAAPEKIRQNPFVLLQAGVPGCGFVRVDTLYCDLALPPDSMLRQSWCAWHAVNSDRSGHTWMRRFEVRAGRSRLGSAVVHSHDHRPQDVQPAR
jgi:hypothetical protein